MQADVENGAFVFWLELDLASDVAHVVVEEAVEFGLQIGGENNGLTQMSSLVFEVPLANTAEVAAMGVLGLEIQMFHDVLHVFPILHQHSVSLIQNDYLNGGEIVVVLLLFAAEDFSSSNTMYVVVGTHFPPASMALRRPRGLANIMSEL